MNCHPILISNQHLLYFGQPVKVEFANPGEEQLVDPGQNFESCFLHHGISLPKIGRIMLMKREESVWKL